MSSLSMLLAGFFSSLGSASGGMENIFSSHLHNGKLRRERASAPWTEYVDGSDLLVFLSEHFANAKPTSSCIGSGFRKSDLASQAIDALLEKRDASGVWDIDVHFVRGKEE